MKFKVLNHTKLSKTVNEDHTSDSLQRNHVKTNTKTNIPYVKVTVVHCYRV